MKRNIQKIRSKPAIYQEQQIINVSIISIIYLTSPSLYIVRGNREMESLNGQEDEICLHIRLLRCK